MNDTVSRLQTSRLLSPYTNDATYATTTYENTKGLCRFLGIYKGSSDAVKRKVAEAYKLHAEKIELILVNADNFSARYEKI